MCGTCGCSDNGTTFTISRPGEDGHHHHHHHGEGHHHAHDHHHDHDHDHAHSHDHHHSKTFAVEQNVLTANDRMAERNRGYFEAKGIFAVNLVSSPGSGKTSLLEATIKQLSGQAIFVIEGDQQTSNDADRISSTGAKAIQINTGSGCHLDAEMINQAVKQLQPDDNSLLMIENVGNLVCPSMFDLGEAKRVVIISVTEGEDKPIKYPNMIESSDVCIINKIDLLPHLDVDTKKIIEYAKRVNPAIECMELSVKTGEGMDKWLEWLKGKGK